MKNRSEQERGYAGRDARQDAGRDESIRERLEHDPDDLEARLDEALDESMDGSDPIQLTDPDIKMPAGNDRSQD